MEDEFDRPVSGTGALNRPRVWTAEENDRLIEVWSSLEMLYNTRHPDYYKRDKRAYAMNDVCQVMGDIPLVDITKKMENLRSYFGREKRRLLDNNVRSKWAYYDQLLFLDEHMIQKKPTTRPDGKNGGHDVADDLVNSLDSLDEINDVYKAKSQVSPTEVKKLRPGEKRKLEETITRLQRPPLPAKLGPEKPNPPAKLGPIIEQRSPQQFTRIQDRNNYSDLMPKEACAASPVIVERKVNELDDDMLFAEHVGRTILSITDELLKEDLKLQIQQCMCSSRRKQIALQREEQQRRMAKHRKSPNRPAPWRADAQDSISPSFVMLGAMDSSNSPINSADVRVSSEENHH